MLETLLKIKPILPELISEDKVWNTVHVDYHPPFVERVWRQYEDLRINLHFIHPCKKEDALFHTHPWPSVMEIISGVYEMNVGYGKGDITPPIATTLWLPAGSCYEMTDPDGWHSVRPLGDIAASLMITGFPWNRSSPKSGYPLNSLSEKKKFEIMDFFKNYYDKERLIV